ncbi:hypothetical protein MKX03_014281 [Papaver bracteatum]|nr:hypothetical protein MKX03_014281 [Papaver bracteatum]
MATQKSFEEEDGELMVTTCSLFRFYRKLGILLPKTIDITSGTSSEHQMGVKKSFTEELVQCLVTACLSSFIRYQLGVFWTKTNLCCTSFEAKLLSSFEAKLLLKKSFEEHKDYCRVLLSKATAFLGHKDRMGLKNFLNDGHEEHIVKACSLFPIDKDFASLLPGTAVAYRFKDQVRLKKSFGEFEERVVQLTQSLPYEILVSEILTRVSLGTLLRQCQWVCRDWHKLIHESNFQLIHSQRTRIASGCFFFIQHKSQSIPDSITFVPLNNELPNPSQIPSPSLKFLPSHIRILGSSPCGSLLCFETLNKLETTQSIPVFYICKPATREWRKIPNPRTRFPSLAMRIVVTQTFPTLQYKIFRFSEMRGGKLDYHCEIFDSNTWVWKRLADVKPLYGFAELFGGVYIHGCLHWIGRKREIHVLSMEQEMWTTTMHLPPDIIESEKYITYLLVLVDGKMGVMISNLEWMELWVLQNYYSPSTLDNWKREYRKDLRPLHREVGPCDTTVLLPNGIIILIKWGSNSCGILYNTNNDTYTIFPFPGGAVGARVFPFESKLCYM